MLIGRSKIVDKILQKISKFLTVLVIDTKYQVLLVILISVAIYYYRKFIFGNLDVFLFSDNYQYIQFLGTLASILAFFSSLSFGFLLFVIQNIQREKGDNFRIFQERIYGLEQSLKEYNGQLRCHSDFRMFVEEMKVLQIEDLPVSVQELHEKTKPIERYDNDNDDLPQAPSELLNSFNVIVNILSRFFDISEQQKISVLYVRTLRKGLFVLVITLLMILVAVNIFNQSLAPFYYHGFQAIMIFMILFFIEIIWIIGQYFKIFRHS